MSAPVLPNWLLQNSYVKWCDIFCFSIAFSCSFILEDINASQNFCHSPRKMMRILQWDKVSLLQTQKEKRRDMKQQQGELGSLSHMFSFLLLLVVEPDRWLLEKLESPHGHTQIFTALFHGYYMNSCKINQVLFWWLIVSVPLKTWEPSFIFKSNIYAHFIYFPVTGYFQWKCHLQYLSELKPPSLQIQ